VRGDEGVGARADAPVDGLRAGPGPLEIDPDEFRRLGRQVVDRIADFLDSLADRPVAPEATPDVVRDALGRGGLPEHGSAPGLLLERAADLLFAQSLFNGHPRFWGYITSSAAPIGALGDLLAAAVNPNVGGWALAPAASELEAQTVRWIAELVGYPTDCGGLLVSGGNMANFVGLWAARRARLPWDGRTAGLMGGDGRRLRVYATAQTHTWLEKWADLSGLGTDAIGWIGTDRAGRVLPAELRQRLGADASAGHVPLAVVATAGSVSTGAVDPLPELAEICRAADVWLHVDGAYGAFAAALPDAPAELRALGLADSVALDPHKWLYAPLEAGCALVRDRAALRDAFAFHPPYYRFDAEDERVNYHEYGPQNSRGLRALKVWLGLQQVGRAGYVEAIAGDVRLARELHRRVAAHPELQAVTQALSITTFRYVPPGVRPGSPEAEAELNRLNEALLDRLQRSGEAFVSHAVVDGAFVLRACVVNFRTTLADVAALPEIVVRHGRELVEQTRAVAAG
jgi:glutamate/tyrosine decarboxylase-like PLP-dependent enzyme